MPQWNPSNICSYHLQEAGATPVQELAFALADAIGVLDRVQARGRVDDEAFAQCVGRVSFFVNAGMRFIEEMCKMRAFAELWDELCRERYGVTDPKLRQFRYGVQVNSLGLTEQQPENNAWRILIEALGVTLSRDARCRALQLPTWNEALSLPRPWDQQWSLRLQQILAYETDLLEYGDLFTGNPVVEPRSTSLCAARAAELAADRRDGRHPRRDRDRLLQARARALDGAAHGADRARRADRRRRQQVDRGPAVSARRRRRRRRVPRRPGGGRRGARVARAHARSGAIRRGRAPRSRSSRRPRAPASR